MKGDGEEYSQLNDERKGLAKGRKSKFNLVCEINLNELLVSFRQRLFNVIQ